MKIYKNLAFSLLALALVLLCACALPQTAHAASADDLTFTLNENGESYTLSSCNQSATGELVIPATYNGLPVTHIGYEAFYYCTKLTNITIPDSVTNIFVSAFMGCRGLTDITIPDSVTSVGWDAFSGCTGLTSAVIGNGATYISGRMFENCKNLSSVAICGNVTSIDWGAFYNCTNLTSVIYCGTQAQWNAIEIGSSNEYLTDATLQFHNMENGVCAICGAVTVTLSVPEGDIHRGDEVAVTVSVPGIEHCITGGFLFDFDTDIFEYVSGEALVSGFGAAGVSQMNGNIAGYFMSGEEDIQGDIFRIILRVKEDVAFDDYTISGEASFSVQNSSEKVPNVVIGATVAVTCDHSYGDWTPIDETWKKRTCTICAHEERDYIDYTVTFQYADGTVISAATYHYGDTVTAPQNPTQLNSVFVGWDREIVACTGDAVYTAVFEVYVPGDMNGDENLTYNDAVYLLLHTMFGEERYPLSNAPSDIDGNGLVNDDDAVYLLLHVFYGEENYPLKKD